MSVRISDIAKELGLSVPTVSKVLNNKSNCSEETKKLIFDKVKELNYQPNFVAKSLATGKTNTIVFTGASGLCDSLYGMILKNLGDYLSINGYHLICSDVDSLGSISYDGLILLDGHRYLDKVKSLDVPKLNIEAFLKPDLNNLFCDSIYLDMSFAVRKILNIFEKKKLRKVLFAHLWRAGELLALEEPRTVLYDEFVKRNNIEFQSVSFSKDNRNVIMEEFDKYLDVNNLPEAIFCLNDTIAIGVATCLLDHNIRIPEDVLISGCDNLLDTQWCRPKITTIDNISKDALKTSVDTLLERLKNPTAPLVYKELCSKAIIRESTM